MKTHTQNTIARLGVAGLALWQCGCAVARPTMVTPPSPEIRAQLGVVSVVSASEPPKTDLTPTRGRSALRGALATAGAGAKAGLVPGVVVMYVSLPFMAIPPLGAMIFAGGVALTAAGAITGAGLGAAGGALVSALATEPASNEAAAAFRNALADSALQEALCRRVEDVARERTRLTIIRGSAEPAMMEIEPGPADPPRAADTLLEVALQSLELKRIGDELNSPVALVVVARGRLLRADRQMLYEHVATSSSKPRRIAEWAADDASPLRAALALAADALADELVDVLFVQGSSEEDAKTESPDVTNDQP